MLVSSHFLLIYQKRKVRTSSQQFPSIQHLSKEQNSILAASVKVSVESVVESLVSKYEKHFDSSRQPSEDHAVDEMIIYENGPLLH